ncbi:hypothetical protein WA1_14605 [Scytonema hofmannii PCC 7110]|uniref:Sulfatase-modifying factor enzyme-like domain-containing protein n=1 Tax=Scytonema hofmannii PCC 7110 TaxID=128403 RepID=A0A139XFB5_9CYAN|nr:formylglycine-generating enzyme family protein [Scytonema hofmannii]KYC43312.1 hypothetical protein WA1_14605 [Scytonema hofmannii PCC 7110]
MIEQAIAILKKVNSNLTAREIAEILWLAVHIEESEQSQQQSSGAQQKLPTPEKPTTPESDSQAETPTPSELPEPSVQVYLPSRTSRSTTATSTNQGTSIKVPAAIALRNSLELGRSLRPLKRKFPSPIEKILDEEATVRRIAEEKIWTPVLKPAPQRWLELALVVEQTRSTAIWKKTITELERLLKHHGAFRDVRTWELRITPKVISKKEEKFERRLFAQDSNGNYSSTPHHPKELIDPKGRRLILLVSDCISPAWREKFIYPVLEFWGRNGLLTVLQLLPERLWERTALASEIPVQLRSLTPGVFNSQLIVENWDEDDFADDVPEDKQIIQNPLIQNPKSKIQNSIPVPIITLEPEPLLAWSRAIAGLGNIGTVGFKFFSPKNLVPLGETQQDSEQSETQLSASALVSRFRATASPIARRLAGLMAAAPVSLSVVHLIQQTLLKESQQIHVAEVFMSGLLKSSQSKGSGYIEYEFIDGIRELLLESVPVSKANSVLEEVSEFIARRVGVSVRDFEAVLQKPLYQAEDNLATKIRPFAELKVKVLRQLGGVYAQLADELETNLQKGKEELVPDTNSQPLSAFNFKFVTVNPRGEILIEEIKKAQYFAENLGKDITLDMVYIPGGTFTMGASENEERSRDSERPQHQVTIKPFFMGKYPVTQAQWKAVAALPKVERDLKPDPSRFKGDNRPVECVSWFDAVEFCARLSKYSEQEYRLPSEAEWEYACRAGTTTPFHFGETITTDLTNYDGTDDKDGKWKGSYGQGPLGEYRQETTKVGIFPANAFGLHDMHGNIWQWCADDWHESYESAPSDGSVWAKKENNDNQRKLLRGGSWSDNPGYCRSAYRDWDDPVNDILLNSIGFRVVCVLAPRT